MPIHSHPQTWSILTWMAVAVPLSLAAFRAEAAERVALVIGNSAYRSVAPLPNPIRDAQAVKAVLEEAKFEVVHASDATAEGIRTSLDSFAKKAAEANEAVVYFAGHAVQMNGANHLLPVDTAVSEEADVARQSLSLDEILKRLDATRAKAKIVILDACRDNPFLAKGGARGLAVTLVEDAAEAERSLRTETGLARVASKGGTFVAFSTSPGATAADGTGDHSPYTAAFLKFVREPGLPVEQLFRQVRSAVDETTGGTQLPWETSSLTTSFAFFDGAEKPAADKPAEAGTAPDARPTEASLRAVAPGEAYRTVIRWDDPVIYRLFLAIYPEDSGALRVHRILAQRQEEIAWATLIRSGTVEDLRVFLALYPDSAHAAEARALAAKAASRRGVRVADLCAVPPPAPAIRPAPLAPKMTPKVRRAEPKEPPKPAKPAVKAAAKPAVREPRPVVAVAPPPPVARPVRRPLPQRIEVDEDDDVEVLPPRRVPVIVRPFPGRFEPDYPRRDPGSIWPRPRPPRGEGASPIVRSDDVRPSIRPFPTFRGDFGSRGDFGTRGGGFGIR
ncbi:caspase family protein [Methylobacterium iners]|uniref:Caspase family p20 domain-containing protein n=1 Tax=Methylobacterium iners TaxID=418707 RepID=A0ABQ4RVU0_9HYPH|nr:caspase family protein [Methylobacterium iners]GJD94721.1 hypothetical protein OCOJLMKI_1924 [Methylobacterium iners]